MSARLLQVVSLRCALISTLGTDYMLARMTYDVSYIFSYIFADVEPKSARTPRDYEAGLVIKFIRHFGTKVGYSGEVVTPREIAEIIAKHAEIALTRGEMESKYMHLFVPSFNDDDLNRLVHGRKPSPQIEETIRNTTENSAALITAYRDLFPDFMATRTCRPLYVSHLGKRYS
jgi:hypothetical protein